MISILDINDANNFKVINITCDRFFVEFSGTDNDHTMTIKVDVPDKFNGVLENAVICEHTHLNNAKFAQMDSIVGNCSHPLIATYRNHTVLVNGDIIGERAGLTNTVKQIIKNIDDYLFDLKKKQIEATIKANDDVPDATPNVE